ncbi:MAG: hypothetical protein JW836_16285 [Deltaproteobacteria bacterium]|nr:hypothetical protein [Deltaproteobacteria bacterium]
MEDVYGYLDQFGFTKKKRVERAATKLRRNDLETFLEGYAEVIKKGTQIKRGSIGSVDLFPDSWAAPVPTAMIRQLSLYADVMYIHDPILNYIYDLKALDINPANVMQYPDPEERLRPLLGRFVVTIQEVLQIKPLVSAGIIKIVPTQLVGYRKDPGAIYEDSFYGPKGSAGELAGRPDPVKRLPKAICDYAASNLYVYPVRVVKDRYEIYLEEPLSPMRTIAVGFPGEQKLKIFNLFEIGEMDEETRSVGVHLDYKGKGNPLDTETFENWVRGSKNSFLLERLNALQCDLYLAALAGARFLTNLPTSRDLARLDLKSQIDEAPQGETSVYSLLQTSLPYFRKVTERQIVKARENELAFYEFRVALRKALKEIDCAGRQLNQEEIDDVVRDVLLLPLSKVETRMKALRRNVFVDGVMLAGTLAATLLGGGNTLTAAAGLLVAKQTMADYKEQKADEDKIRESPGFFYWDVTKKARAQERNRK